MRERREASSIGGTRASRSRRRSSCGGAGRRAPKLLVDPNALSPDGSVAFAQWAVSPDGRYLAYGLAAGRRRLADRARAGDRDRARPRRSHRVVPLLRDLLDEGRQGLLLLALPRAPEGTGALTRPSSTRALLPPGGHAPGRGPLDLRAPRPAEVVRGRRRRPRTAATWSSTSRRVGSEEPALLRRPRRSAAIPGSTRPSSPSWTRTSPSSRCSATAGRVSSCAPTSTRRSARSSPSTRACAPAAPAGSRHPRAQVAARGRGLRRGQALRPVPRGRQERGRAFTSEGKSEGKLAPARGGHGGRPLAAVRTATSSSTRSRRFLGPTTVYRYDLKSRRHRRLRAAAGRLRRQRATRRPRSSSPRRTARACPCSSPRRRACARDGADPALARTPTAASR